MIDLSKHKWVTKITPESSEYSHQCRFFEAVAILSHDHPGLKRLVFAVNNEERSGSAVVGARRKAMGVKAGVSDVVCLLSATTRDGWSYFLAIEFKKPGGRQTTPQKEFAYDVREHGGTYAVVFSWQEGLEVLCDYLSIELTL